MTADTTPSATPEPRALPVSRVFDWFKGAMQLFKRSPWIWCALGAITLASRLALELVPGIGRPAAEVIVPVIECGLLIGAARLDRGAPLELGVFAAAFRAPPVALAAIVASSLVVSAVELATAFELVDVNLFTEPDDPRLTGPVLLTVISIATLASLPFVFVPFAALFDRASFGRAFGASLRGFVLNTLPLLVFGAFSLVLTLVGVLTYWVGLIVVYPLLAAASYAAWKDVYARQPETFTAY